MSLPTRLISFALTVLAITVLSLVVFGHPGFWALTLVLGSAYIIWQDRKRT